MTNDFQLIDGTLSFPKGTQYIKSQSFSQREDIYRVILPEGLGFMEDEVFAECPNLREVILPEGIIGISVAAFASCEALEKINIPASVKSIEDGAFLFCENLRSVALPEGLEEIAQLSFQGSGLESIRIPSSVKSIGEEAFFECEGLYRAEVCGKYTRIGPNAFGCCYNLKEGYIAPGYPEFCDPPAELLYTLLWCSCPERHDEKICRRAESFVKSNGALIMEKVLKSGNNAALSGLVSRGLLTAELIEAGLRSALADGAAELAALLLEAKRSCGTQEGEFDL